MLLTWGSSQGLNALMNSAEFIAGFADAGSGAVDLTLSKGTGSATFTRATTATTVNSAGLIVSLGLNLFLRSEAFDNASWIKAGGSVTADTTTSPDGTQNADTFTEDSAAATQHRLRQDVNLTNATVYTMSAWVKRGAGTRQVELGAGGTGAWIRVYFNLDTNTVANAAVGSGTITSYPNGWVRITATGTCDLTGANSLYLAMCDGTATGSETYNGNGTSSLIWYGAQLETGSSATAYAKTTTTANSAARSCYDPTTLAYLGYLSEGARTNLCLQSADFGTTWTTSNVTVSTNQVTSPDGGTNADAILEAATTSTHFINQNITIAASTTYACSVFVRGLNRTWCAIEMIGVDGAGRSAFFNLSGSGSVGTTSGTTSTEIKAYPSGWYRCTIVAASGTGAGTGALRVYSATADNTASFLGNTSNGVYAWGAQLEAGSFASTYIPTTTASVTRNADVLTYPSSGNVSGTVGTCYAEIYRESLSTGPFYPTVIDVGTNRPPLIQWTSTNNIYFSDGTNNVANTTAITAGSLNKVASSWGGSASNICVKGINFAGSFDGNMDLGANITVGTNNAALTTYGFFGTIRNVRIYQTQLSASQLQAVTG